MKMIYLPGEPPVSQDIGIHTNRCPGQLPSRALHPFLEEHTYRHLSLDFGEAEPGPGGTLITRT